MVLGSAGPGPGGQTDGRMGGGRRTGGVQDEIHRVLSETIRIP